MKKLFYIIIKLFIFFKNAEPLIIAFLTKEKVT